MISESSTWNKTLSALQQKYFYATLICCCSSCLINHLFCQHQKGYMCKVSWCEDMQSCLSNTFLCSCVFIYHENYSCCHLSSSSKGWATHVQSILIITGENFGAKLDTNPATFDFPPSKAPLVPEIQTFVRQKSNQGQHWKSTCVATTPTW